jgi:hypothetical protein
MVAVLQEKRILYITFFNLNSSAHYIFRLTI